MNSHLNLFKPYSKEDREYQLENDLTRALAICLQEEPAFLYEVIKEVFKHKTGHDTSAFEDISEEADITISIQEDSSNITDYNHLFAVSLSGAHLDIESFFDSNHKREYDPICDLIIQVGDSVIIIEAKRDNTDCTHQLYNQAYNIWKKSKSREDDEKMQDEITPVDLNWEKLMGLTIRTANFQELIKRPSRFLNDFIQYIQAHYHWWIPEYPLGRLDAQNKNKILQRIETAINSSKLEKLDNRLGFAINMPWAKEILFHLEYPDGQCQLFARIYPGNTKKQGESLFQGEKAIQFKREVTILGQPYKVHEYRHIKFASQRYITGLWFKADNKTLKKELYTNENFWQFSGRRHRRENNWADIKQLFDEHFTENFDWKKHSEWEKKMIGSNRSRFDLAFGYELSIGIPLEDLQRVDIQKNDLEPLQKVLYAIKEALITVVE